MQTADTVKSPAYRHVRFQEVFDTPPVVVVLAARVGGDPMAPRISNVTRTGFDLSIVEPAGSDGRHGSVEVDYVAAEKGVHTLPSGDRISVGTIDLTAQQISTHTGLTSEWETLALRTTLDGPAAIVTSLQTRHNETAQRVTDPSSPWLTLVTRWHGQGSAQIALERSEVATGEITQAETAGFIAFPAGWVGQFTANDGRPVHWSAMLTSDMFIGTWQHCKTMPYAASTYERPHVVASKSSRQGNDGGWLRRCALADGSVGLQVDEDVAMDEERVHTAEKASVLTFSRSFHANLPDAAKAGPLRLQIADR